MLVTARHTSSMTPEMTLVRPRGDGPLRNFLACVPLDLKTTAARAKDPFLETSTLVRRCVMAVNACVSQLLRGLAQAEQASPAAGNRSASPAGYALR